MDLSRGVGPTAPIRVQALLADLCPIHGRRPASRVFGTGSSTSTRSPTDTAGSVIRACPAPSGWASRRTQHERNSPSVRCIGAGNMGSHPVGDSARSRGLVADGAGPRPVRALRRRRGRRRLQGDALGRRRADADGYGTVVARRLPRPEAWSRSLGEAPSSHLGSHAAPAPANHVGGVAEVAAQDIGEFPKTGPLGESAREFYRVLRKGDRQTVSSRHGRSRSAPGCGNAISSRSVWPRRPDGLRRCDAQFAEGAMIWPVLGQVQTTRPELRSNSSGGPCG
jgi:hypothetical protein